MNPSNPAAGPRGAAAHRPARPLAASPRRAAALAAVVLLSLTACGTSNGAEPPGPGAAASTADATPSAGSPTPPGPLLVGAPDATREARIMAALYAGALNRAGIEAEVREDIGEWAQYEKTLRDGRIDVVPEYTGQLLFRYDADSTARSAGDVSDELSEAMPDSIEALAASDAARQPVLVMTRAGAVEHEVETLDDLGDACADLAFGGRPSLLTHPDGLPALRAEYECEPESFTQLGSEAEALQAVITDRVQVAQMVNTDPNIARHGLVIVKDSADHFTAQRVVPVVHRESVGEEAREVLDRVSAELTGEELAALNSQLMGDAPLTAREAAATWLTEHGFGG
ncbi:ABC transporter substrate-binding protein [Zhihengliuella salsuginis]|uniref:Glycine/betaine ABC transporter substrate-binding protein n=1 Tax=Zhihengliuella salsuginis TaxID=578222 RepID=A0ABQ3GGY8_9MICC|nr:ABC transporter substrate-binding protein [Zhihengliuella salsuginis]GHD04099.1 glycine/betaine ABC transporter substrate-binding protein [Zhihengliuella salsuginis]